MSTESLLLSCVDVAKPVAGGFSWPGRPGVPLRGCRVRGLALALRPLRAHSHPNECPHPYEVVRRVGEREDPADFLPAAMMEFAQSTDRLAPAEALFDEFPLDLTHGEARVSGSAPVDRASEAPLMDVGTDMRGR